MISLKNEKNVKKNQKRTYTKTFSIKKWNICTLSHRFKMWKQQKKKQKKENDKFFDLDQKYDKIDNAATEHKK